MSTALRPGFFGAPGSELFGVYEPPAAGTRPRETAVLVCQPVGQEYVRCHRALRLLARRLGEAGFPVLRFDFFGCGDSAGESDEARLGRWVADVGVAAAQLRAHARPARLAAVGVRLGASLAWRAAAEGLELDRLVLWEPVVSGAGYRRELDAQHTALFGAAGPDTGGEIESLGFAYSRELLAELEELRLEPAGSNGAARSVAARTLLLEQAPEGAEDEPAEGAGGPLERRRAPGTRFWLDEPFQALMPEAGLRAVVDWLVRWA